MEAQGMEKGAGARPRRVLRAGAIAIAIGVGLAVIAHALAQAPAPPATAPAAAPAAAAPPPQPDPSGTATGTVADVPAKEAGVNTMLASAAGAIAAMFYMWARYGKPDPSMAANGFLGGLVAITAPCAFTSSFWAVVIGGLAGLILCWSVFFVERTLKVDDPVGAISVHGTCGAWGVLSLGLFADGTYGDGFNGVPGTVKGLFYGDASQLVAQIIGPLTNVVFIFVASWVFFKVVDAVVGMRVSAEEELEGLDVPEMGVHGYPEIQGPSTVVRHIGLGSHAMGPVPGVPAREPVR